jgi:hypothetical protein
MRLLPDSLRIVALAVAEHAQVLGNPFPARLHAGSEAVPGLFAQENFYSRPG